jgi:hypothetical protein
MTPCLDDDVFIRYVEGALSVDETAKVDAHAAECRPCHTRRSQWRTLVADLGSPRGPELDVRAHVRSVMGRLDGPVPAERSARHRWVWAGVGSAAACALAVALVVRAPRGGSGWQSRGGFSEASMARDVLVRPCTLGDSLVPVTSGAMVDADVPWTAIFRNVGEKPAFILLFAVDARHVVHWIAPQYARPEDHPSAVLLLPSTNEKALGTTAVFDDVSPGVLRVVAVVSTSPTRVSDVEALDGAEWDEARLRQRLPPDAVVRETIVEVRAASCQDAR